MAKAPKTETVATEATEAKRNYEPAVLTGIATDIPMPEGIAQSKRGGRSAYPFDSLEVLGSFGVKNKTMKQMSSTISAANKRHMVDAKDENGNTIYKTQEVKQADGTVTRVPTLEPEKVPGRVFVGADVDPNTDHDGASVRIWRKQ